MSTQQDLNYLSMLSRKNAELKARVNSQINAINANSAQLQQGIFMQGNPAVLAKQPTVAQTQGNAMSNTAFSAVFAKAESMKGTPYFFGGSGGKGGIDCSGFVQAAMKAGGVDLPRTADEMYNKTKGSLVCTSYDPSKMQSGDLIFFKGTQGGKGGATHVGIYIKEGKMYQSGRGTNGVGIVQDVSKYMPNNWLGVTRPCATMNMQQNGLLAGIPQQTQVAAPAPENKNANTSAENSRKPKKLVAGNSKNKAQNISGKKKEEKKAAKKK